jgi:hypothetical protein
MPNKSDRSVADMVDEALTRQAKARTARTGESFEHALEAVLGTEAGRQLRQLGSGPHRYERAEQWQANVARERAEERADALGRPLPGEVFGSATDAMMRRL